MLLHHGDRDGATLSDEGNAAFNGHACHLIRPERDAVEEVGKSVAIRADERQFPCRCIQFPHPVRAVRFLAKSRRKHHRTTQSTFAQCRKFLHGQCAVDAEKR